MTELDIRIDVAPDAQPDGDPGAWSWMDIASYRRQSADVQINTGRDDEAGDIEAGDASATFDLRDGLLSPRNPRSELYGRVGTNTPIRYRLVIASDDFSRTVASGWGESSGGQTWVAPAAYSVGSGAGKAALAAADTWEEAYLSDVGALDIDYVYSVSLNAVTTGAPWISAVELRRADADNLYRVHTELKPGGVVTIKATRLDAGVQTDLVEDLTTAATYIANSKVWTRVQADGGTLRAKTWSGVLADEPLAWNIVTSLVRLQSGGVGMLQWRFFGNTNVGTLTASVDDLVINALLWSGNIPEWPPRWDKSGQDSTITLLAAGPFRRLNQGNDPVKSPLARQLPRYSPAGYWKLEDAAGATQAASGIPGGKPGQVSGVTFAGDDTLAGASTSMKLGATGTYNFTGKITGNTTGSFAAMIFVKFASLPASDTRVVEWWTSTGTVRRWTIRANATGWQLKVYDSSEALLLDGGTASYINPPTDWTAIQLETTQNGVNIDWKLIWNKVGDDTFWFIDGTIALNISSRLTDVRIPSSTGMVDASIGHIWAGTEDLPFVTTSFLRVSSGYIGELASDRIQRLCDEKDTAVTVHNGASEPLGRQRAAKFLDLLRESARSDMGVLYERQGVVAYLPRAGRTNVDVTMTLDWAAGELAEAPEPTDDDQRLRNKWTISRTDGSEATAQNDESIAKSGTVEDSDELNIQTDDRLPDFAAWYTHLTTYDAMRWPSIQIDLVTNPQLVPSFLTCRIGSRIRVISPKDQVAGISIDLIIEGIKQSIGRRRWDVTLTCSPAQPWDVGVWDEPTRLWGSRSTVLNTVETPTSTTWQIATTNVEEIWSTTASGYQWTVAGEDVTVQSVGAATGTGPYLQTVTVTRGDNLGGTGKDQTVGTPIRMKTPARWAL